MKKIEEMVAGEMSKETPSMFYIEGGNALLYGPLFYTVPTSLG